MQVIIAGAGEIGWYTAEQIAQAGHDVTLIDNNEDRVREATNDLDVRAWAGPAGSSRVLMAAGAAEAALVAALTGSDETNLVCASVAKKLGARLALARVDDVVYRKAAELDYATHFGVDDLVSPQMLAALELASVVRNPGSLAVEHFARGALEMQQFWADEGAENIGKPLRSLALPAGVRVGSIKRGDALIIARGEEMVAPNDLITLVGKTDEVAAARRTFEKAQRKTLKIVVMGGGHVALSLARRLRGPAYKLTVIERDARRCDFLAEFLPKATILHGDGTRLALLQEERIENADFFISTTASDEANIMGAMQAQDLGVGKTLVVIHRPDYAGLVEKMGVHRAVSPRVVMARELLAALDPSPVTTLAEIDEGNAVLLRLVVRDKEIVGRSLRDIALPPGCLVLARQRDNEVMIPTGETVFQLQDKVLLVTRPDCRKPVVKLITG